MTEDYRLAKITILIQQKRYSDAEKIIKELLYEDSNNTDFLSLLAEIYLQQDKVEKAKNTIDNAIGLSPDYAHLFFIKSRISVQNNDINDAEENIKHAITLDSFNANYFAMWAHIKLIRKQFNEALKYANEALEIDPENLLGLNTRSTALVKLDKGEEAFETIEGALREDPNNAYTHANYGWGLLEKGNYKKAKEHFKESLKNDPNFEYAQAGMLQAIKATNPVYRLFLKYSFWMSNLTSKYKWAVIIGFYVSFRILNTIAVKNEALRPYLNPLLIVLAIIAFSTWVMTPISNLFLRFNPYGQLLLDRNEKLNSNFVATSFVIFITGILLYFLYSDDRFLSITIFGFTMMLPFSLMFSSSKYKYIFLAYAIIMSVIGVLSISLTFITNDIFNILSVIYLFGFIAFQWIGNFLTIKEN